MENLNQAARNQGSKLAIVGIGSELHGDDAIGIALIRRLSRRITGRPNLVFIEGGTLPESITGPLRRFEPHHTLLIDAADFQAAPGSIRFINPVEIGGYSASTHTFPLNQLVSYIQQEFACSVNLIGVQPKLIDFETSISEEGKKALNQLVRFLCKNLRDLKIHD